MTTASTRAPAAQPELLPCPFCAGQASKSAYDRGIDIGCESCGYSRHFPGLLQTVPNDKPIAQYRNSAGGITEIPVSEATEFYHADANERAVEAWNRRAQPIQQHSGNPASTGREGCDCDSKQWCDLYGKCHRRVCGFAPYIAPVAAPELDVEAERLLRECKRFMEDMHSMPVEWTIKESQVLHEKVSNALAARTAATSTKAARAPGEADERTYMTDEQAEKWAWEQVKRDVGTDGWTAGDNCNYFGFFLWGWRYRSQYERQSRILSPHSPLGSKEQDK